MINKTKISAQIVADSVNQQGDRLTTFIVTFPRIVLAELNTHRMFSRNSASSRAIPFKKMLQKVKEDPFIPLKWMKDHKGMQGNRFLSNGEFIENLPADEWCSEQWLNARDNAVDYASSLNETGGVTKQFCNRLLEPFLWHTAIITSSEWENFFALRAHEAAEIHIQHLAFKMLEEYNNSTPTKLLEGHWHIPFGEGIDEDRIIEDFDLEINEDTMNEVERLKVKIATARCARVSYLNYEGTDDYKKDVALHERLSSMGHWSPFEHCARVMTSDEYYRNNRGEAFIDTWAKSPDYLEFRKEDRGWSGNFKGFIQYRKLFKDENKKDSRIIK